MRTSIETRIAALGVLLSLWSGGPAELARAATLYWDGTDTTADADGGSGVWDTGTTANWDDAAVGGVAQTWTAGDHAVFGGVAGSVTNNSNLVVSTLQFGTADYTVQLQGASAKLDVTSLGGASALINSPSTGGARLVTLSNDVTVTWSGKIGFGAVNGAVNRVQFTKNGAGTFEFAGELKPQQGLIVNDGGIKFVGAVGGGGNQGTGTTLNGDSVLDLNGNGIQIQKLVSGSTSTKVTSATAATLTLHAGNSFFDGKVEGGIKIQVANNTSYVKLTNPANNFTGGIDASGGFLLVANASALGSGAIALGQGGRIRSADATAHVIPNAFAFNNNPGTATFGLLPDNSGALTFTSTAAASLGNAGVRDFVVNVDTRFACGFTGSGRSVLKSGDAALTFAGASTYNGGTVVTNGALWVCNTTGSGTGTGAVNVHSNAVLGGTGTISGVVTNQAHGSLTGGTDGDIGTLTLTGGLTLAANSRLAVQLDTAAADKVVVAAGTLAVTGPVTVDPAALPGYAGAPLAILDWSTATGAPALGDFVLSAETADDYALLIEGKVLYVKGGGGQRTVITIR